MIQACPSSSIITVGSIWSHFASVYSGFPMASRNGPVGLSLTATPMAMPVDEVQWAQTYQ